MLCNQTGIQREILMPSSPPVVSSPDHNALQRRCIELGGSCCFLQCGIGTMVVWSVESDELFIYSFRIVNANPSILTRNLFPQSTDKYCCLRETVIKSFESMKQIYTSQIVSRVISVVLLHKHYSKIILQSEKTTYLPRDILLQIITLSFNVYASFCMKHNTIR